MLLVVALLCLPVSTLEACSIVEVCPHHGFEAAKKFTVAIRHAGMPLKGVLVEVISDEGGNISKTTGAAGVVQLENLRTGNYHIDASMLGIDAIYECFHVAKWTTGLNAKRALTYNWGDDAPETRQIAGKITSSGSVPDADGQHLDAASAAGVHLILTDPVTGLRYETTSSPEGLFLFSGIVEGVYVLHSDGIKGQGFYPGDVLIRLNPAAARTELLVGAGNPCGGRALELLN
jgi:hypothetical protein